MSGKKRKYVKKPFESSCISSDVSANIYESMLVSKAYKDLTPQQKSLYTCCKAQLYSQKKKPIAEDNESFTMPQSKWAGKYGLYKPSNYKGFQRDMEALINHGFIICVQGGENTRTPNIYKYSAAWHNYGTAQFEIPPEAKTPAMKRKDRKKERES